MSLLRHLFTVLLLVLMPLQAISAVEANTVAPALARCEQIIALACYEDDSASGTACQAACSMVAIAVAPPVAPVALASKAPSCAAVAGLSLSHTSYIPNGPQRPPCIQL